ncbi:MAG: AAA family ATPase [Planctomycetaceae bacterium]|nr:AAA family ATPase [Planctomycetaceae bacterium]
MQAPYVRYLDLDPDAKFSRGAFPGNLPFVEELKFKFESPVTFFVGENGSGKSTLLEAIAVLSGFPLGGGSRNELAESHGLNEQSQLAELIRLGFGMTPKDGYFFRAELQASFASLLDQRKADPDFRGDPYAAYGGQSLLTRSHGEAFLSVIQNRFTSGLFLMDEPESALSPQRQLTLLTLIYDMVNAGASQVIIATHSPILLTYPDARIVSFDHGPLKHVTIEETSHHQITTGILSNPEAYWRHLRQRDQA